MGTMSLRIRELLAERGERMGRPVQLAEVAQATGIPVPALTDMYHNRAGHVSLQWLAALCDYFGCVPADLLRYEPSLERSVNQDEEPPLAVDAREIVERWERDYGQDERPKTS